MYVVYLIQHLETREIYVGKTSKLERCLSEHNSGSQKATHRKNNDGKWVLVYAEAYRNSQDANEREFKLKQRGTAKQGLKRRIKRSLLEIKK